MEMTRAERAEFLADCREKARQCRDTASRIRLPDQQKEMEETAQMWDRLAENEGGGAIDEMLAAASEGKPEVTTKLEPTPPTRAIDTDES